MSRRNVGFLIAAIIVVFLPLSYGGPVTTPDATPTPSTIATTRIPGIP